MAPAALVLLVYLSLLVLAPSGAHAADWIYTVRPGDNLWDLTEQYLIDIRYWRRLQALNGVSEPTRMPPGRRLRFPIAWLKIQPAAVRVLNVQGKAEATIAATGQTIALRPGLTLHAGDALRTGNEGNVDLEFADGSRLLVQANSQLVMDTLSSYGKTGMVDTRMRLQHGRIDTQVAPSRGPATRYEIHTPAAVSAVRGTDYRVGAEPDRPVSRTEVRGGRVAVTGAGTTRLVPASFGTVARAGQPPAPPVRLLPPPDLAGLPALVGRVPIQFRWAPLNGAAAYRVQIAPTRDFKVLLLDRLSPSAQLQGPDLPDGDYVLRIRGIDSRGLEGLDAYHRFRLNARPEPPILVGPEHGETVREQPVAFRWSEPLQASSYHFQLADNDRFEVPLIDTPGYAGSRLSAGRPLQPGRYYWRVATRDAAGEEGPFSDPQDFRLQPPPPRPVLRVPRVEEDEVVFRWTAGLPGQRYQFQLARDAAFDHIVEDAIVSAPQVTVARPASGRYYLRVRTIDVDGFEGHYGGAQRIDVPPRSFLPLGLLALLVLLLAL